MREAAMHAALHAPLLLLGIVAFVCAMGAVVPGTPIEPVMIGVALVAPAGLVLPVVAIATTSHMATKTAMFVAAQRLDRALPPARRATVDRACARMGPHRRLQRATLLVSAVTGVPPFMVTTLACAALRLPLREYLAVGATGRLVRFAALMLLPRLLA